MSALSIKPPKVLPTPVGVFLTKHANNYSRMCLPHARGGVSLFLAQHLGIRMSSPRPWGCFCRY